VGRARAAKPGRSVLRPLVNEQVTTELDLVDNDVLRVGATRLVFKSAA
jgi:hypothetical protein